MAEVYGSYLRFRFSKANCASDVSLRSHRLRIPSESFFCGWLLCLQARGGRSRSSTAGPTAHRCIYKFCLPFFRQSSSPQISNLIYTYSSPHLSNKMAVQTLEVRPLDGPHPQFGAEIDNVDLDNLSDADFETIRNTLYNYHVIVLKNQAGVSPKGRALSKFLIVVKVLTKLDSSIRNHQKI